MRLSRAVRNGPEEGGDADMAGNRLLEALEFRELLYFLTSRDVKIRYKQTLLGAAWAVIQPLSAMIIFTVFFGRIAKITTGDVPYPLFAYAALAPWTYFSAAVVGAGNSFVNNTDLITKVYFPRLIIPTSAVLSCLVDFAITTALMAVLLGFYGFHLDAEFLVWPLAVALLMMLALGVGMFLAALNVRFRDIKYALPFGIQMLLFLTPIIYPVDFVPEAYRPLMALNPLTGIIEACRASLLHTQSVDWGLFGISAAMTVVIFVGGYLYFQRTERDFADVI
jgi:lipopolysaccharide transport system permease protein